MRKWQVLIRRADTGEQVGACAPTARLGSDLIVYRFPRNSLDVVFQEGVDLPHNYESRFKAEITAAIAMQYLDPEDFEVVVVEYRDALQVSTEK